MEKKRPHRFAGWLGERLCHVQSQMPGALKDPNIEWIQTVAKEDPVYQQLLEHVRNGFPSTSSEIAIAVRPYFGLRNGPVHENRMVNQVAHFSKSTSKRLKEQEEFV